MRWKGGRGGGGEIRGSHGEDERCIRYVNKGLTGVNTTGMKTKGKDLDIAAHQRRRASEACTSASSNALELTDRLVIELLNGKAILHPG